jgi:hypothetical protein
MQHVRVSRAGRIQGSAAIIVVGLALVILLGMAKVMPASSAPAFISSDSPSAATYDAWQVGHQVVVPFAVLAVLFLAIDHAYLTGRGGDRFDPRLALGIALFLLVLVLLDASTWLFVQSGPGP